MNDLDAPVTHRSGEHWIEPPPRCPRPPWTYDSIDPAIMLFTAAVDRFNMRFPPNSVIVELGCAETDWLERMHAWDPSFRLTGVDQTVQHREQKGFELLQASALDPELFPPDSLDWVVLLGALEHFGLGFYGDPVDPAGDVHTLQHVRRWLRPGGFCYFDVPVQPVSGITANRHFRFYSPADLGALVNRSGLVEINRAYSLNEPHAGTWCHEPTEARVPYYYGAILAEKR